jgi:hypothetical protein
LAILASGSVGLSQSALDSFLPFALAIQPDQVLGRRCLDAALLGHAGQHLAIAFAAVAPNNRAKCCVGFNR